jgi:N-acetylglucosaminyl-diphospho-decaprenol L-rhamnosyltransferase
MTLCDAIVVSYNSRDVLRRCVAPLAERPEVRVIVVDNASVDGSLDVLDGAPVVTLAQPRNEGFARACNVGWRSSDAPFVLLLNPDAVLTWTALRVLIRALEEDPDVGVVGPRLERPDGALELSQHRFPRLSTTYGQALFLHRLFRRARFEDDVRDAGAYARPQRPDWLTGACLLVRRSVLEALGGLDERFFLYREDVDLCRRVRDRSLAVRYEPRAVALHDGGGSSRPDVTLPLYAASRIRYAQKHRGRLGALLERLGLGLRALTHVVASRGGVRARVGHAHSLAVVLRPRSPRRPP